MLMVVEEGYPPSRGAGALRHPTSDTAESDLLLCAGAAGGVQEKGIGRDRRRLDAQH